MKKWMKWAAVAAALCAFMLGWSILRDRRMLDTQLVRLHVVADSDSEADQAVKLKVRDAVIAALEEPLKERKSVEEAKDYLMSRLSDLEALANQVLDAEGYEERAAVTLSKEEFPTRYYDTFTLPAGVYESLRITIGSGEGHNWWCVVFPSLCVPATVEGAQDVAASSGFSDSLSDTLTNKKGYEVRFFILDWLGRVQNFFHRD